MRALNCLVFFFALQIIGGTANALELHAYGGPLGHSNLGGCCTSSGTKIGGGLLGRLDLDVTGEIQLLAYSDGRWSEGQILKPFYIIGGSSGADGAAGELVNVRTVHDWRWLTSFGGGYFSHTTKTKKFDLPVLVTGITLSAFNHLLYSINDKWSVGGLAQISVGISASDQSFVIGTFMTVGYEF